MKYWGITAAAAAAIASTATVATALPPPRNLPNLPTAMMPAPAPAPDSAPSAPASAPASAPDSASASAPAPDLTTDIELSGETIEITSETKPGAATAVDEKTLERTEHDDVHAVLQSVPGVYVREEDGYGLRPNIGIRGAAAERSAKVALMEDGVLIAPAPYSAPAAYYFPIVTRMSRVEVTKGPAAVVYGPNTVGGAVNMVGAPMPAERSGYVDAALGSDLYGKLHGRFTERGKQWGVMAEYVKLRTDGFKNIDGGGDSGFDKNDVQLWARVHSPTSARLYHQVDAKVGYSDETSNETYTGLSQDDFAVDPQRRYAATQLDQMNWDHWRFRLSHKLEVGSHLSFETTAYRNALDRAWGKVDAFVGNRDLFGILAEPTVGANAVYYSVLTGQSDSSSPEEELLLGTNDRQFVSQGVQTHMRSQLELGPTSHQIEAGVRLHNDRAIRRRTEESYQMIGGTLVRSDRPIATVVDSRAEVIAGAFYAQDQVRWSRVAVTAGARVEQISSDFEDQLTDIANDGSVTVFIPGGGAEVFVTDQVSMLAGVHRGFVPVAPSGSDDIDPESSVNYEAGARWRSPEVAADVVGFYSDYSNLKGSCSLSSGCTADQDGDEFNGGAVHVWGFEAQAATDIPLPRALHVPLSATYTLTRSAFQSSFESSFAAWGDVEEGDELPYLPSHQASLAAAVAGERWEVGGAARWHGQARDVAGQGDMVDGEAIDSLLTLHLNAHVRFADWAELYATCDNLLDEQVIVSRRPYGARPNAPRRVVIGYKARF